MFKKVNIFIGIFLVIATRLFTQIPDLHGRILFVSDRSGHPNIWIQNLQNNELFQLTHFPDETGIWFVESPRWSPDGRKISFGGQMGNNRSEIFIINDDGSDLTQLTDIPGHKAYLSVWDPVNLDCLYYIRFTHASTGILYKLNITTRIDIKIPNARGNNTQYFDITPDGQEILFCRELHCCWTPNMYTGYQDMLGSYEDIIKETDGKAEFMGRINKRDRWITYHELSGHRPPANIYKMDMNGYSVTQITFGIGGEVNLWPVWTDGDNKGHIIFQTNQFGNHEIAVMLSDPLEYPTGIINISNHPAKDMYPDWTPFTDNQPPIAVCNDIEVAANSDCQASITPNDIDGGSYDPDDDETTLSINNSGPFPLGVNYVNLTITDELGESDTCQATVTVIDGTPPNINLSDPVCENVGKGKGKMSNRLFVSADDNCTGTVIPSDIVVEIFNGDGDLVSGRGIYEIKGQEIFVFPNANGWSICVTATAEDDYGNITTQRLFKPLIKCEK